jgi:hypothetical protein
MAVQIEERRLAIRASLRPQLALWFVGWVGSALYLLEAAGAQSSASPPYDTEAWNVWSCTSIPITWLHGMHQGDSSFNFFYFIFAD